ncbi:hypothetical protein DFR52_106142 [Hoeflea marina]|uniref:Uncharacterized protein n=1 Tax=Hoeflea marina TaxID=274592 RepID=A0A317PDJ9_9HYPH|nr:hypothetical protein [Hoeflea marina]PWV97619.1 hypothetical protein DFR52_106142 [Hoeflea marina]
MERILTLIAFVVLCGFLGVLIYKLPRLDLGIVVVTTLVMAFYDLFIHKRRAR